MKNIEEMTKEELIEITYEAIKKTAIKADFHTLYPEMYEANEEEKKGVQGFPLPHTLRQQGIVSRH